MTDDEYSPEHATAERRCSNCTHYSPSAGECRRYPPTLIVEADGDLGGYFPNTNPDWVCGEHVWGWGTHDYRWIPRLRSVLELKDES